MKSKILPVFSLIKELRRIAREASRSRLTVYAAQASFFTVTSAVPFVSLILAAVRFFLPSLQDSDALDVLAYGGELYSHLSAAPGVPLLSISAVTALWSASRGISAIRGGIGNIYGANESAGFIRRRIRSLGATAVFIFAITMYLAVILLAALLLGKPGVRGNSASLARLLLALCTATAAFTALYCGIARKSRTVKPNAARHIPGAVFSSVGWIVFSELYSLYIKHFPSASSIYGGIAAICLIMLWIYFCAVILLLGAVLNKLYFAKCDGAEATAI